MYFMYVWRDSVFLCCECKWGGMSLLRRWTDGVDFKCFMCEVGVYFMYLMYVWVDSIFMCCDCSCASKRDVTWIHGRGEFPTSLRRKVCISCMITCSLYTLMMLFYTLIMLCMYATTYHMCFKKAAWLNWPRRGGLDLTVSITVRSLYEATHTLYFHVNTQMCMCKYAHVELFNFLELGRRAYIRLCADVCARVCVFICMCMGMHARSNIASKVNRKWQPTIEVDIHWSLLALLPIWDYCYLSTPNAGTMVMIMTRVHTGGISGYHGDYADPTRVITRFYPLHAPWWWLWSKMPRDCVPHACIMVMVVTRVVADCASW